ncbi:MAG TPA: HAD-IA family hydrolase [Elusimicrobiota bacterium]|nr:HAD-IA family hydrolase [Elusimicrobiota bacterium]
MPSSRKSAPPAVLSVDAILFDLDGTLVDTIEDITLSLNHALARLNKPPKTPPEVARFIGDGIHELVHRALGNNGDTAALEEGIRLFKPHYDAHCADHARLYPGVLEILNHYADKKMAVVTNKLEEPSRRILQALKIDRFFPVLLGGDSFSERKPSPGPLLEALRRLGVPPEKSVMVGDSPGDVVSGKAAGTFTCTVSYGFRTAEELRRTRPDIFLDSLAGLRRRLR